MEKLIAFAAGAAIAIAMTLTVTSTTSRAAGNFADDRSEIEDLQARLLFALDFRDPDVYVSTFNEDGILDVGSGAIKRARGDQTDNISDIVIRRAPPS